MPRPKKELAENEALPNRGQDDLLKWFDRELHRRSEHHTIERLSEAVTTGGNRDLLRRSLTGKGKKPRPLKLVEAVRLSNELKLPISELLALFGFELETASVEVWGQVDARGRVSESPAKRPVAVPAGNYGLSAVEIVARGPLNRAVLFYNKSASRDPGDVGRWVIAQPVGAVKPLAGLLARGADALEITPLTGGEPVRVDDLEWSARVLWVRLT